MTVIAIAGDDLVTLLEGHLHAHDDRFLSDIQMAEAADRAHSVKLTGFLFKTADQHHLAKRVKLLFLGEREIRLMTGTVTGVLCGRFLRCCHSLSG